MGKESETRMLYDTPVQVCPECDIADCACIRKRRALEQQAFEDAARPYEFYSFNQDCGGYTALGTHRAHFFFKKGIEYSQQSLKTKLLSNEMVEKVADAIHNSKWLTRQEKAKAALQAVVGKL